MSKKEKPAPVVITWWKLITVLVTFTIAIAIAIISYNIYISKVVS